MGEEAAVVAMVTEAEGTVEAKAAEAMEAEVMDVMEKAVVVREEVGMAVVATAVEEKVARAMEAAARAMEAACRGQP